MSEESDRMKAPENCKKCGSNKLAFALIGWICWDCNEMHSVEVMQNNFTKSLIERYSEKPPEHNRPGRDGVVDSEGNIVKAK